MSDILYQATKIVEARASNPALIDYDPASELKILYATLKKLDAMEQQAGSSGDLPSPEKSIGRHHVICLECNRSYKLLSNRHLALHSLTPRTYKKKHGIPMTQPLSSKELTAKRRKVAQKRDMGRGLAEWRAKKYGSTA
jgi:predicted transcriptional regulator